MNGMKLISLLLALLLFSSPSSSLATVPAAETPADFTDFHDPFEEAPAGDIADPLEPLNRASFWLNDHLYTQLLRPLCLTIPEGVRQTVADLLDLFGRPLPVGGAEFQLKFRDSGSEIGRFALHGVLGLLGRLEPEKMAGLAGGKEDFGRTIEAFGFGSGFYLVLPVLGPSSLRDGIGRIASFYLDPSPHLFRFTGYRGARGSEDSLLSELATYEAIRKDSLDPYLFIRDAYVQQREADPKRDFFSMAPAGRPGPG